MDLRCAAKDFTSTKAKDDGEPSITYDEQVSDISVFCLRVYHDK